MRGLPSWAKYLISGLAAILLMSLGVNGSLLLIDRQGVTVTLQKFEEVQKGQNTIIDNQNLQINELKKFTEQQNHINEKFCWYMTFGHKERLKVMDKFPVRK